MRAVVILEPGGPDVLHIRDVPTPEPGPEQVRVRVRATALNRADLLQRMGMYPAPPGVRQDIPGMEFAGEVDALGAAVASVARGDRVFGIVGGASYAEYVVTHERMLARVPANLDDVKAAAVPEAFITAHDALFTLGGLRPGGRVLIHAVASGVGVAAVQLARASHVETFGTARTASKLERVKGLGLQHAVPVDGFADSIAKLTNDEGVDVVVDFVGAGYLAGNLLSLSTRGRLVLVGLMGGTEDTLQLGLMLRKRLQIVGTTLRGRPLEEKIAATRAFEREVVPLLRDGVVKPVVDEVLPLEKVREAHEHMAANTNVGKIVLTV